MNRGQLSRRERKARIRFVQCYHYNHREQQIVDDYIHSNGLSYAELWKGYGAGKFLIVNATIGCRRLSRAMAAVGFSAEEAAEAFARLGDCMREAEKGESV